MAGNGPLSLRAPNRATLGRPLLLRRAAIAARPAVAHLAGLQARLAGFRHHQLKNLLTERAGERAHLMRNTVHLLTAEDFVSFRPLFQPLMERGLAGHFGRNLAGVDLAELRAIAALSPARLRGPTHLPIPLHCAAFPRRSFLAPQSRQRRAPSARSRPSASSSWTFAVPAGGTGCPVLPRYRDSWTESVDPARSGQLTDPGPQRGGQGITVGAWTTRRSWLTSAS